MNDSSEHSPVLNIYVVGEITGDHADWDEGFGYRAIVVAGSPEEARKLSCQTNGDVAVLEAKTSGIVMSRDLQLDW